MKKILLFMLPIMALSLASCEKNQGEEEWTDDSPIIQFKDPYFLNAVLEGGYRLAEGPNPITGGDEPWAGEEENVDKNGDGQISEKEASVVEALSMSCAGIRGMDEIKYFTALTWLECDFNDLTSLDLSKNTALTQLECRGNELTSLDLSKNTALEYLYCHYNPLQKLILYKYHVIDDDCIEPIESEYGDIIEYVE